MSRDTQLGNDAAAAAAALLLDVDIDAAVEGLGVVLIAVVRLKVALAASEHTLEGWSNALKSRLPRSVMRCSREPSYWYPSMSLVSSSSSTLLLLLLLLISLSALDDDVDDDDGDGDGEGDDDGDDDEVVVEEDEYEEREAPPLLPYPFVFHLAALRTSGRHTEGIAALGPSRFFLSFDDIDAFA